MKRTFILSSILASLLLASACASEKASSSSTPPAAAKAPATPTTTAVKAPPTAEKLEPYSCGSVERLHTWNGIFAGSQPAADDLRHARDNGIKTILNFRPATENPGFDEAALVQELGMKYENLPFASPAELTDEVITKARSFLRDETQRPMFVHCHSGNRVGAIWLAFRTLDGGLAWDEALAEAKQVGLKTPALEQRVREYVDRARAGKLAAN
jgi:uncharacterized protein (TIGR01244 family)